jgi:hypothetical protein
MGMHAMDTHLYFRTVTLPASSALPHPFTCPPMKIFSFVFGPRMVVVFAPQEPKTVVS